MKKIKRLFFQALAIKCAIVVVGIIIMGTHYVVGYVWFAMQANMQEIEKFFREHPDADVNQRDRFGLTGLMFAAGNSRYELAKLLIERGADMNLLSQDEDKNTALNIACFNGDFEESYQIAILLIQKGAQVNIPNGSGQCPIHYLMEIGGLRKRLYLLELLFNAGADLNIQNKEGATMLHLAVNLREPQWIQVVRKKFKMIRTDIKNNDQQTPLDLARVLGFVGSDSVESALIDDPATFSGGYYG